MASLLDCHLQHAFNELFSSFFFFSMNMNLQYYVGHIPVLKGRFAHQCETEWFNVL